MGCTDLVHDRDKRCVCCTCGNEFRGFLKCGYFLNSWGTISFLWRNLLHGISHYCYHHHHHHHKIRLDTIRKPLTLITPDPKYQLLSWKRWSVLGRSKNFTPPPYIWTRNFITAFTKSRDRTLSRAGEQILHPHALFHLKQPLQCSQY
jgi:hypothetical protein